MANISDVKIYASNGNAVGVVTDAIPVVMANVFDTVKNATGVDSVESARELLQKNGIAI